MVLQFRNFAHFVTYPIYFNVFKCAVKCSLSCHIYLSDKIQQRYLSSAPEQQPSPQHQCYRNSKKPFKISVFLQVQGILQFLKLYVSTTSTSCSCNSGILKSHQHLKAFLSNAAVCKMHVSSKWFVAKESGTTVSPGKKQYGYLSSFPLHCLPSHTPFPTLSYPLDPSATTTRTKQTGWISPGKLSWPLWQQ